MIGLIMGQVVTCTMTLFCPCYQSTATCKKILNYSTALNSDDATYVSAAVYVLIVRRFFDRIELTIDVSATVLFLLYSL